MRTSLLILTLSICFVGWNQRQSQQNLSEWRLLLSQSKQYGQSHRIDETMLQRFPINKIHGTYYVSLFGKTQPNVSWSALREAGVLVGSTIGDITTVKVPLELIHQLDFSTVYSYIEIPAKVAPNLDKAVKDTHADSVQHGWNLPEPFTGKDVLIGITDWGFDYTQPMFYDTLLTQTRIHAAWDQFKQTGDQPAGYSYGVEYDNVSELLAAGSDTANIYSYNTHGTHVGGIAGGSGAGLSQYRGFAFESEFLFTTFLIDAASVIDAFNWMKAKADAAGKRLVINMSWGLYYMGTLDGNSLLSQAIAQLSDEGVVFVASAGNNGNVNFHIKKTFNNDSFSSRVNFYDYSANANMWGQSITMWGEQGNDFTAGISLYNSGDVLLNASPLYAASLNDYIDSFLVVGPDTIFYNVAAEFSNPLNNRPNMRLRAKCTNTNIKVVLKSAASAGTVHYWNVTELVTGVGNWGMPLVTFGLTDGLSGDSQYSIGEPTCSPDVISVGAYASGYINGQGNPAGGTIASFTSTGPIYTEEMKPDISAPGVSVASSISSFTDAAYTQINTVNFNGTDYDFARFSGTSMASPCVAGIVALMLDANQFLSAAQVKSIIKSTARLDQHTGVITAPGHTRWGMGKINAYQAIVLALNTVSLEELKTDNWMIAYPNPGNSTVQLLLPENALITEINVVSTDGKTRHFELVNNSFDAAQLAAGSYFIEAVAGGKPVRTQFVKY
ncbi:MAG TPA: S8 family peptidase [Fluviicola sp.]|nr:S8 family peptidase [Fluviicola sp.]